MPTTASGTPFLGSDSRISRRVETHTATQSPKLPHPHLSCRISRRVETRLLRRRSIPSLRRGRISRRVETYNAAGLPLPNKTVHCRISRRVETYVSMVTALSVMVSMVESQEGLKLSTERGGNFVAGVDSACPLREVLPLGKPAASR